MAKLELTGIARLPLRFLRGAPKLGLAPADLLQRAGLRERDLRDPDARVPLARILDLWRAIIDQAADPVLGLSFGRAIEIRHLGLVGYAMYYSATLGDALRRLVRYCRIINEAVQCDLRSERGAVHIVIDGHPLLDALRHPIDARLAAVLASSRKITESPIVPLEVRFPYRPPANLDTYASFFRAPLRFNQSDALIVLDPEVLALPIKAGDSTLSGYLDRLADEALDSLTADATFADRARRAIWAQLSGGAPTVSQTADWLGVSPRTPDYIALGRAFGTHVAYLASHSPLLLRKQSADHVRNPEVGYLHLAVVGDQDIGRRDVAMKLLPDRSLAVYEVAFLLGYSEPSTFYRAFRRWTGRSPHAFRRSAA